MSYGRYGEITYETKICPICSMKFTRPVSFKITFCSLQCSSKNTSINGHKSHSKWKRRLKEEREIKIINEELKLKKKPLETIIDTDNYGEIYI